ncbi:MAG: hypothetical protein AB7L66_07775 [Gemmatimonadales bacterium]
MKGLIYGVMASVALTAACSKQSVTCQCTDGEGMVDFIDIDGGNCSDLTQGSQGFTSCVPVIAVNGLLGPDLRESSARGLPSLDRAWWDRAEPDR